MLRFIASRLLGMVSVMVIVVTVVFVIGRIAPGDPAAAMLGPDATKEAYEELRQVMGLNGSITEQYVVYVKQILRGDLGQSIFLHRPVIVAIADRAEPTIALTIIALIFGCSIALPIGVLSAYWKGSSFDKFSTLFSVAVASVPNFWLALLLIQLVAVSFGLLPVSGYGPPSAGFWQRMTYLILPGISLGIGISAIIMRFTRASMLDILDEEYIRTARSKGMSERNVVLHHALRNALVPILTIVGLTFSALISGVVVTETVFGLPGLGSLVVNAVTRRDYPVIEGTLLVVACVSVLVTITIDLLYLLVDPRLTY